MMLFRPSRASQSGVTLVEMLVALFVISLMAGAGAVLASQALRGARAVETRGAEARELAVALSLIASDFAAYTGRPSQDPSLSAPPSRFEGYPPRHDGRIVVFIRNGWADPTGETRSDLQRVEYRLENQKLIRRSWAAPDPGPGTRVIDQVLLDGVKKLDARFSAAEDWSSDWLSAEAGNVPAPVKAEFAFTFAPDDTLTARFLIGAPR